MLRVVYYVTTPNRREPHDLLPVLPAGLLHFRLADDAVVEAMMGRESLRTARHWEKQEAGWYTSDIGGICHETDGWAFWPQDFSWPTLRKLPTLGAAMAEADRLARVRTAE